MTELVLDTRIFDGQKKLSVVCGSKLGLTPVAKAQFRIELNGKPIWIWHNSDAVPWIDDESILIPIGLVVLKAKFISGNRSLLWGCLDESD